MSKRIAFKVFAFLWLAVGVQAALLSNVSGEVVEKILVYGLLGCTAASGFLVLRYESRMN